MRIFDIKNLLFIILLGCSGSVSAVITIDSLSTTPSNCQNNGTISVYAQSPSPMLFALVSGPDIRPPQSGYQFDALPAGTYQVRITNFSNDTALVNATVGGTYQFPDFTPTFVHPFCDNSATGVIVGNANTNMGTPPFRWELLNIASNVTTTQTSDSFLNLPAGDYRLRQIDSCQSFATRYVTLQDPNRSLTIIGFGNNFVACDTISLRIDMSAPGGNYAPPYTIQVQTPNETYQHTLTNISYGGWYPIATELIGGVSYGDIINITITDACGQSTSKVDGIYDFHLSYSLGGVFDSCQLKYQASFNVSPLIWNGNMQPTSFLMPISAVITNPTTGAPIDSFFMTNTSTIPPILLPGQTYQVRIQDQCGHTYTNNIAVPTLPAPSIIKGLETTHCLDSTASFNFRWRNYFSAFPTFELLSGPSNIGSTKPNYVYHDTIIYPQSYPTLQSYTGGSDVEYALQLSNLGVGTYHYRVTDTCGNSIVDSFTIRPQDVSNYQYQISYTKGCPGQNKLNLVYDANVNAFWGTNSGLNIVNSQSPATIVNLNSGEYLIQLNYYKINPITQWVTQTLICQTIYDTIVIPPYEQPEIAYATQVNCNGAINVSLQPDSNKGVPPYRYEIISGPQTAPEQISQFFTLTQSGNYVARISDTCGFARTFSFFVDTLSLLQVVNTGASCLGDSAVLVSEHSPYATYVWQKPNGSIFTGDTLHINPLTSADYGIYSITKFVNVNGCRDTFYAAYTLSSGSVTYLSDTICEGGSYVFGGYTYFVSGTYYDTISTSSSGCDSISGLNLYVLPLKRDTVSQTICYGQSYSFGGRNYSVSGTYSDTIATSLCDSISVLRLQILPEKRDTVSRSICYGESFSFGGSNYFVSGTYSDTIATSLCDSISILNLNVRNWGYDSVSVGICEGQSVAVGSHIYSASGIYHDTLVTAGCDSIHILNLHVLPLKRDSVSLSICEGQSVIVGSHIYSISGIYRDTLATAGCDSIHVLNLQVISLKRDTISRSICNGQSVSFGGRNYFVSGMYPDTIATSLCDSISVLNLTVLNGGYDSVSLSICPGQSITVGANSYSVPGIYRDTFATTSCDSIHILNLQVIPLKRDTVSFGFCEGESITIGSQTYTQSGLYTDTFATSSCDSLRTINVTMFSRPVIQATASNEEVISGDVVQLNVTGNFWVDYFWTSAAALNEVNIQNPTGTFYQSAWALVMATDSNNCSAIDSVFIAVRDCEGTIYVPNAFTPNSDGVNDILRVYGDCIHLNRFMIFNRWGEKMWDTTDIEQGWDGYYIGVLQPVGVYVYWVSYSSSNPHRGMAKELKGSITLIR